MTQNIKQIIERVRELDAKATPGPWMADEHGPSPYVWANDPQEILVAKTWHDNADQGARNRDFIAYTRTAAPILAQECERLAKALDDATAGFNSHGAKMQIEVDRLSRFEAEAQQFRIELIEANSKLARSERDCELYRQQQENHAAYEQSWLDKLNAATAECERLQEENAIIRPLLSDLRWHANAICAITGRSDNDITTTVADIIKERDAARAENQRLAAELAECGERRIETVAMGDQLRGELERVKAERDEARVRLTKEYLPAEFEAWEKVWQNHVAVIKERDALREKLKLATDALRNWRCPSVTCYNGRRLIFSDGDRQRFDQCPICNGTGASQIAHATLAAIASAPSGITDSQRLDWLEKRRGEVEIYPIPVGGWAKGDPFDTDRTEHETLRAAIDAAIAKEQP